MHGRHVVEELVGVIRQTLRPLLPPPGGAALLDFPAHTNAGDSLLYLGQQRILRGLGHRLAYVADTRTYSAAGLRARVPEGPIFLQGGGDLADRWLGAPSFYQQVFRDFPERAIVQLPLSTAAMTDGQREALTGLVRAPRNLLLLVRDQPSLDRARVTFPEVRVEYAPDLAVGCGVLRRPAPPDLDVVLLLRDDSSRYDAVADLPREVRWIRTDWGLDGPARLRWKLGMAPAAAAGRLPALRSTLQPLVERSFESVAQLNVRAASALLSRGRFVITDRLHAAVLAALMGIPVAVLDQAGGKIAAAYHAYFHRFSALTLSTTAGEARDRALSVLTSS